MSRALEDEYHRYQPLTRGDRDALIKEGVPAVELLGPAFGYDMVRVAHIKLDDNGLWSPADRGARAYVTPVRVDRPDTIESREPRDSNRFGEIVDLVAWRIPIDRSTPSKFYLREGEAEVLGTVRRELAGDNLPSRSRPIVELRADPLDWLRHRGEGTLVLTQDPMRRQNIMREIEMINAPVRTRGGRTANDTVEAFAQTRVREIEPIRQERKIEPSKLGGLTR